MVASFVEIGEIVNHDSLKKKKKKLVHNMIFSQYFRFTYVLTLMY